MPDWVRRWFPSEVQAFAREDAEEASPAFPVGRTVREGKIDTYSDTWFFVSQWAEAELRKARDANDSVKRTESETFALRGRIKVLKELLNLHEPHERKRPTREPDDEY